MFKCTRKLSLLPATLLGCVAIGLLAEAATAGPVIPSPGKEARFFDLLRRVSALPGDIRSGTLEDPSVRRGLGSGGDGEDDATRRELDLLLGRPDRLYLGGRAGGRITLTSPDATVVSPRPVAPSLEAREDWGEILRHLSTGDGAAEAKEALERLRRDPAVADGPGIAYLSGMVAFRAGDYDAALADFAAAAERAPKDAYAPLFQGVIRLVTDDPGAAVEPLRRAAGLDPENGAPRAALGEALVRLGRFAEAVPQLRAVVTGSPKEHRYGLLLARALLATGRPGPALEALAPLRAAEGYAFSAHALAAAARLAQGDFESSVRETEEALRIRPGAPYPRALRAFALTRAGRAAEALPGARELAKETPGSPAALAALAAAEEGSGNHEEAQAACRRWIELMPGAPAPRLALARSLLADGDTRAAIEEILAVRASRADTPIGLPLLGDAYEAAGRKADAEKAWRRFLDLVPKGPRADEIRKKLGL